MNTGSPPTAPNARTGELTPPGITAHARWNRLEESTQRLSQGLFARIGEELERHQPVRQRVPTRVPDPLRTRPAAAAARGQDVTVPAVPAQPGHRGEAVRLAVQVAGPPFVLVGGRA